MTTEDGSPPVLSVESFWLLLVVKNDTEPSSGLTMATMASSSLMATVLAFETRLAGVPDVIMSGNVMFIGSLGQPTADTDRASSAANVSLDFIYFPLARSVAAASFAAAAGTAARRGQRLVSGSGQYRRAGARADIACLYWPHKRGL